ncbi:MAG: aminotransferase class IV [Pyrinomonadaceae bacterium]
MHKFASFNRQIKSASEIYLSAVSSATFYGRSVFTTVAVYHAKPFQWEKHWRRLTENAARIGVDLSSFSEQEIKISIDALISENSFQNGRMRLTFFDESGNGIWSLAVESKTSLLITTADFRAISGNFCLTVSPFQVNSKSPLANLKLGNYLENILALEEARRRGFDEAICLNEKGEIVSAIMANIFWVSRDTIFTTPLETGALKGTTRDFIIENFKVLEKKANLDELKSADEIFLTSAGFGIVEVKRFENKFRDKFTVSKNVRKFFDDFVQKTEQ